MGEPVAIGPLGVTQSVIEKDWKPQRNYDLFVTALSWETRGTAFTEQFGSGLPPATILRFASSDPTIDVIKEAKLLTMKERCPVGNVIALSHSTSLQENYNVIESLLRDRSALEGRPLRVLIDISCLPKAYVMFFVGAGFSRDYLALLDCIYVPGRYDHGESENSQITPVGGHRSLISLGDWRPELVPYLNAAEFIPVSRDLLVTLGGELGMARSFMERVEPERTRLFFIEEDAPSVERQMVASERIALKHMLEDSRTVSSNVSLGDVIELAEQAVTFVRESTCGGVTGMALGTKSHALALAIASLSETRLEIISRVPAGYKGIDVVPLGQIHFFQLTDRFEPCSYIDW